MWVVGCPQSKSLDSNGLAALVLGDFVYIDGGEIAMLIDNEPVIMLSKYLLMVLGDGWRSHNLWISAMLDI